jgi:triose/dihydroxyacetone kinase / FAD-AMP lyase (cyclizing)
MQSQALTIIKSKRVQGLGRPSTLGKLDSLASDGGSGTSIKRAAQAILDLPVADLLSPSGGLAELSASLRRAIAGSHWPLYETALIRALRRLAKGNQATDAADPTV